LRGHRYLLWLLPCTESFPAGPYRSVEVWIEELDGNYKKGWSGHPCVDKNIYIIRNRPICLFQVKKPTFLLHYIFPILSKNLINILSRKRNR
jgi:hypothetical protein